MTITPDLAIRARALHSRCFVADAHYDLLNLLARKRINEGRTHVIRDDYLKRWRDGGLDLIVSSIFLDTRHLPEMALRRALDQIAAMHEELDECPELVLCRSVSEIRAARAAGRIALLLSFEGVEPLGNDLNLLRVFYELGVRGIGLTWNRRNFAADGLKVCRKGTGGGLTDFGAELLDEAQRLGMYVDVSHLTDEGFADVLRLSSRPFIASHSNSRALTNVPRNLTDEQLRAIAGRGGLIGLNCAKAFIRLHDDGPATASELAVHAAHIKQVVGAEHLCLGFDFCSEFQGTPGVMGQDSIDYYDHAWELTAELLAHGFSEEETEGVLGNNLLNFLEKTIG